MTKYVQNNQNEVKFFHPEINTSDLELLIQYIKNKFYVRECIQISLDNCTIQRMEKLTEESTLDDVKRVGLYPLYRIINECPNVLLTALGVIEMPGNKISKAYYYYELFCQKFWKGSSYDINATYRKINDLEDKFEFEKLHESKKQLIGMFYLPFLLIQKILIKYKNESPITKLNHYIYGIIYYLDMISAFELELAKYAFWELSDKEVMSLPESIRIRRKFILKNFVKKQSSFVKCKKFCINAAMDSYWIRANTFGNDNVEKLENGYSIAAHFLATNDDKLYFIAKDVTPSRIHNNSFGYEFVITREDELLTLPYWSEVDMLSMNISLTRKYSEQENKFEEKISLISSSVKQIEAELENLFLSNK